MEASNQSIGGQLTVDATGNIYVVDNINFRIQKLSSIGDFIKKWGNRGSVEGQLLYPCGLAIDDEKGFLYVSDNSTQFGGAENVSRVVKFDHTGNLIQQWILTDDPGSQIMSLAVDKGGILLTIQGSRVFKYDFC